VLRLPHAVTLFTARIEATAFERRELYQALRHWTDAARRDPGVRSSSLYEDLETPGAFLLFSEWESRMAFEAHLCGLEFGVMVGAWELLARAPQVRVTDLAAESADDGLVGIRRLRERGRRLERPGSA
jgi:quinol monooxygenase YgiN